MYGITSQDISIIDTKIESQKRFLTSKFFDFGDETKSALDFTYSANINPKKYFSEMNNRINSIFDYAKGLGLKPVFITLTAPSKFHKKDRNGNLKVKPNQTAKELTQIFNKFTSLQIFRKLKKQLGHGLIYFRVYEPHKSGVPHLHAMLFLPNDWILDVKKKYFEYFTKKDRWNNNKKSIDFKYTWYNSSGGAVAYIMKYVTKTFKNDSDMSTQHASYWYIKHNIRRFLCSRTLAPITLYRKVRHFFKNQSNDYLKVTEKLKKGNISFSFNPSDNTIPLTKKGHIDYKNIKRNLVNSTTISYMFYNHETGEIEEVTVWQKNSDLILQSRIKRNDTFKLSYKKKEHKKALKVYVNDFEKYSFSDNLKKFILMPVVPSLLKDYQLVKYFKILDNADIDTINYTHYGLVRNEMIKRNLLQDKVISLNNYRLPKLFANCNAVKGGSHVPLTFIVADEVGYDVPFI